MLEMVSSSSHGSEERDPRELLAKMRRTEESLFGERVINHLRRTEKESLFGERVFNHLARFPFSFSTNRK